MKTAKGTTIDVYSTHCTGAHVGEVVESLRDAIDQAPARVSVMLRVERRDGESCGLDDTLNQSKDGHLLRDVPVLVSPSQDDIEALLAREPFVGVAKARVGNGSAAGGSSTRAMGNGRDAGASTRRTAAEEEAT